MSPQPSPARRLRELLAGPDLIVMPGCHDGLSARILQRAGVKLGFMSGFAVSAARLGLPDTGLISFADMAATVRDIAEAAPGFLFVADGDTGYGNAVNVQRTVREYARAGAAAVMIEDQVMPKRCDAAAGKQVVDRREARLKIRAAVDAARDADILVLARTDARTVLGFEEALARCHDFAAEGADILFLDSPADENEIARVCRETGKPCMASVLIGGATPAPAPRRLAGLGVRIACYPHALLAAGTAAMQQAARAMAADPLANLPPLTGFGELKTLAGFDDYLATAARYT